MAWMQGDLITAAKLNSENTNIKNAYSCASDWGKTSVNSPYHFMHQTTGRIMYLRTTGTSYWWAEGDAIVYFRNAVGAVTEHRLWYEADTTSRTLEQTVYMETFGHGPGWYSGRAWVNRGYGYVDMYWAQDNCNIGEKLVCWDSPTNSGNRIVGGKITADILNSGRVGTI